MSSIFTLRGVFLFWAPIILIVGGYLIWDSISPIFDNLRNGLNEANLVAKIGMGTQHYHWVTIFFTVTSVLGLRFGKRRLIERFKVLPRSQLALAISTAVCSAASIFLLTEGSSWANDAQVISLSVAILYIFAYLKYWQVMFFDWLKWLGIVMYLLLLGASGTTSVVGKFITNIHDSQVQQQQEWLISYEPAMVKAEAAEWSLNAAQFDQMIIKAQDEALIGTYTGSTGCGPTTRGLLERPTRALPLIEIQQSMLMSEISKIKGKSGPTCQGPSCCTSLSFTRFTQAWTPIKSKPQLVLAEKWDALRVQLLAAKDFQQSYRQAQVDNPELRLRDLPIASLTDALKRVSSNLNLVGWLELIASLLPEIILAGGLMRHLIPSLFLWPKSRWKQLLFVCSVVLPLGKLAFDDKGFCSDTKTIENKLQVAVILTAIAVGVMIYNALGGFAASLVFSVLMLAWIIKYAVSGVLTFGIYAIMLVVGLGFFIHYEVPQKAALAGGIHTQYQQDKLEANTQLILLELVAQHQAELNQTAVDTKSAEWIRAMAAMTKSKNYDFSWEQLIALNGPLGKKETAAFQKLANLFDPTQNTLWESAQQTVLGDYPILEVNSREFLAERGKAWKPIEVDLALVISQEPARTLLPIMVCLLFAIFLMALGQFQYHCYCSKANTFARLAR